MHLENVTMHQGTKTFVFVFVFGLFACNSPSTQCTPGAAVSCTCDNGTSGSQVCDTIGRSFGACNCLIPTNDMTQAVDIDMSMSKPVKRIFVTSRLYSGNLKTQGQGANGLEGADKLCQLNAMLASIGGTWKAWISDANTAAIDRINDVGPWYLMDGITKVFDNKAQMKSLPYAGINLTETKKPPSSNYVWTGTHNNAIAETVNTCANYSSGFGAQNGYAGDAGSQNNWTDSLIYNCINNCGLYCVEQ